MPARSADQGNLHDEVERLVEAGILADRRVGRTRLLRATDSPFAGPLADLLLLGYGPRPAAERALRGVPGVEQAFIGGSWAARYEGHSGAFPHDIDVIVVGSPDRDEVTEAVVDAMRAIGKTPRSSSAAAPRGATPAMLSPAPRTPVRRTGAGCCRCPGAGCPASAGRPRTPISRA